MKMITIMILLTKKMITIMIMMLTLVSSFLRYRPRHSIIDVNNVITIPPSQ